MTENENKESEEENGLSVSSKLFWLLVAGFVLVFIGVLVVVAAVALGDAGGSSSAGVVIFVGPFPIVFGVGPNTTLLIGIGIVLAIVSVILFVLMRRKIG